MPPDHCGRQIPRGTDRSPGNSLRPYRSGCPDFLGYPLHAPGKKDRLRDAPLYDIRVPMLFFEGTRDPFCDLDRLNMVFPKLCSPKKLAIIEHGDHGFGLPKSDPRSQTQIFEEIARTALSWLDHTLSVPDP